MIKLFKKFIKHFSDKSSNDDKNFQIIQDELQELYYLIESNEVLVQNGKYEETIYFKIPLRLVVKYSVDGVFNCCEFYPFRSLKLIRLDGCVVCLMCVKGGVDEFVVLDSFEEFQWGLWGYV